MPDDDKTKESKELYEALQKLGERIPVKGTLTRKPGAPTTRIKMSTGQSEPVKQQRTPWYESALFWGFFSLGFGILLTVVAAMRHDIRWLLWFAAPCFIISAWALAKNWLKGLYLWLATSIGALLIIGGITWMYVWLHPTPVEINTQVPQSEQKPNSTITNSTPSTPAHKLPSKPLAAPTAGIQQSNSGGTNVQQATTGENSPIINSPITVGDVPKRISPADLTQITQYLSEAKPKSRIRVVVAQNSNAIPFANDIYRAFKDAGWAMDGDGVAEAIVFFPPGKKFQGVDVTYKHEPIAPNEPVQVRAGEPLFPIGAVLKALKVPMGLKGDPDQKDADLITLQFEGLPD